MENIEKLYKYLPNETINWELIKEELLLPYVDDLEKTMQEPKWHSEGNVLIHTHLVIKSLIELKEYQALSKIEKLVVFLAALFHDIGKIVCTKVIDGEIRSYHHGATGAKMLREYLWKDFSLAGSKEYQEFREGICLLIKYHSTPVYTYENLEKKVVRLSLNSKLTKYYNLKLLSILAKADTIGRISLEKSDHLENLELFIEVSKELDCYEKAFNFKDSYTKYHYLNNDDTWLYDSLYNQNYGEVILLCGLPGTGKDTFIKNKFSDLPVISLDDIREEENVDPNDEQGQVYNIAKERAKELLRAKKEFIWNATNISKLIRNKQIDLFHRYNASVRIIFLETSIEENLIRNNSRSKEVNEKIIFKLLKNLEIPEESESEYVEWICV